MIEETDDTGLITGRGTYDALTVSSFKIRSHEFEIFSIGHDQRL